MSEAKAKTRPAGADGPFMLELINLDRHADGLLLQLCSHLATLRGHVEQLEKAIVAISARTDEGAKMKTLTLYGAETYLN